MKNRNFPWAIIAAAAVAGAGFAGVATYVRNENPQPSVTQNADDPNNVSVVKDPLSGGTNSPDKNGSNTSENTQIVRRSKVNALNDAIKSNKYDAKGIRVLDVTVENGNAIIDMNDPVRYNWGSQDEAAFITMMKDTLTPFESINTFQIRVDGEILKTLSHFEVDPVKVRQ